LANESDNEIAIRYPAESFRELNMQPLTFLILFAVVFPVVWFGGLYLISVIGPWRKLSQEYPCIESVAGTSHWFVSLRVGPISYSNCLTAVSNTDHLTLMVLKPFRPFHPPFTLPRTAVTHVETGRFLFVPTVSFMIGDHELRLFGSVATSEFWLSV
jgi:hypothetical protein